MSLGWMLSVGMIVRAVVKEKETRMKEVMKMMGLGRGQLWLSWFTTSFITLLISVIIITLCLKVMISMLVVIIYYTCSMEDFLYTLTLSSYLCFLYYILWSSYSTG